MVEDFLRSPGHAFGYALVFLGVGFVWGALAANIPALRAARPIPHFASNRAIAIPILVLWTGLAYVLARRYLTMFGGGAAEGLRLGIVFAAAAILFDLIVVAGFVGEGWRHFRQPVLWVAYVLLVVIPWVVGYTA